MEMVSILFICITFIICVSIVCYTFYVLNRKVKDIPLNAKALEELEEIKSRLNSIELHKGMRRSNVR